MKRSDRLGPDEYERGDNFARGAGDHTRAGAGADSARDNPARARSITDNPTEHNACGRHDPNVLKPYTERHLVAFVDEVQAAAAELAIPMSQPVAVLLAFEAMAVACASSLGVTLVSNPGSPEHVDRICNRFLRSTVAALQYGLGHPRQGIPRPMGFEVGGPVGPSSSIAGETGSEIARSTYPPATPPPAGGLTGAELEAATSGDAALPDPGWAEGIDVLPPVTPADEVRRIAMGHAKPPGSAQDRAGLEIPTDPDPPHHVSLPCIQTEPGDRHWLEKACEKAGRIEPQPAGDEFGRGIEPPTARREPPPPPEIELPAEAPEPAPSPFDDDQPF